MSAEKLSRYLETLADLKFDRDRMLKDLEIINGAISGLEARIKAITGEDVAEEAEAVALPVAPLPLSAGALFAGDTIHDAARKYLRSVKEPQTVRQIWEALTQNGLPNTNYNAVYTALWRRQAPKGYFKKVSESHWTLADLTNTSEEGERAPSTTPQEARVPTSASGRSRPSQLDYCEQFLRDEGRQVHINRLISKLAEVGRKTTVHSLSSTLRQDPRNRFRNLGQNVWALTEWARGLLEPEKKESALPYEV